MVIAALLVIVIAALVALYLIRPRYRPVSLSAARFFEDSPESNKSKIKLHLQNLLLSRSFWLQLAALLALLAAVFLANFANMRETDERIGLWLVLDTSASMSTQQDGVDRMQAARQEIDHLVKYLEAQQKAQTQCVKFSTFDLEMNTSPTISNLNQLQGAVADITPRALGTDLSLIQSLLNQAVDADKAGCSITHVLVISDSPPSETLIANTDGIRLIWLDVAKPVPNIGITSIHGGGQSLWQGADIEVEVAAYVERPVSSEMTIADPAGRPVLAESLDWRQTGIKRTSFTPQVSGMYSIHLSEGGAYAYDDTAAIEVIIPEKIRVDWQLPDRAWLQQLGWQQDAVRPDLRVTADLIPAGDSVPTLIVGNGYGKNPTVTPIDFFDESSALLDDLNLDVAESLNIRGIPLDPDTPFRPVLLDTAGSMWLAAMSDPKSVYIPGLPTASGDENADAFTTTAFFNAVRVLLDNRESVALYELTSPAHPEPDGKRIALHPGEGNTSRESHNLGDITDIKPEKVMAEGPPLWPLFVALAAALLLLERSLTVWGGSKWS